MSAEVPVRASEAEEDTLTTTSRTDSNVAIEFNSTLKNSASERVTAPGRLATTTLGCKINAYETRLIERDFIDTGWSRVDDNAEADIHIVNTCTVTAEADRQARQAVRRIIRNNPDCVVVVTGCYAQMSPDACAAIPGVDFVVGNDRKLDIHRLLPLLEQGSVESVLVGDLDQHVSLPQSILTGFEGRARAFVQIQQGCDQGCTFCIIHRARGPSRSLPLTLIRRQVERLVMNGYREIVLCGVDLGSWGADLDCDENTDDPTQGPVQKQQEPLRLSRLVEALDALDGDFRIRLSSIDPVHLDDDLIQTMALSPRVCPHIHLSMQSGSTMILKRMKRRATRPLIEERVAFARQLMPDLTLSADVITGFPTETEQHFSDTIDAIERLGIGWPHVFPYSAREGTPAARIPSQIEVKIRKQRAALVRAAGAEVLTRVLAQQAGTRKRVLVERAAELDKPAVARADDYCTVRIADVSVTPGQFLDVKIASSDGCQLFAA